MIIAPHPVKYSIKPLSLILIHSKHEILDANKGFTVPFLHFLPSDKLRRALGIRETEHPPYIYRMRQLGYPPGYKLLAVEETLTLYEDNDDEGTLSRRLDILPFQMGDMHIVMSEHNLVHYIRY